MKFATVNFMISNKDGGGRCYVTCSVHDAMGEAIQKKIDKEGRNFQLDNNTLLNGIVICKWTDKPEVSMNHYGYLSRLLGIVL